MSVTWVKPDKLMPTMTHKLKQAQIVLDIGCGIRPQSYLRSNVHICCEPFEQYVANLQDKIRNDPDKTFVIVKATWDEAVRLFPPKSVDTIFLNDVIEHLEKDEAIRLLKATESLARKQIAVFTPLGFMPQNHPDGKDAWGLDGGDWQEHKSGWNPEDFDTSWDVIVAEAFHLTDSMGQTLESPFGALWAIKSFKDEQSKISSGLSLRQRCYAVVDLIFDTINGSMSVLIKK